MAAAGYKSRLQTPHNSSCLAITMPWASRDFGDGYCAFVLTNSTRTRSLPSPLLLKVPRTFNIMAIGKCAATLVALTLGRLVPVLGGNYHNNCESDQQQALCIQDQCSANKGSGSLQCTGDDLSVSGWMLRYDGGGIGSFGRLISRENVYR